MTNNRDDNLGPWVDESLSSIRPDSLWAPDVDRALTRLQRLHAAPRHPGRRQILAMAAIGSTAAALGIVQWSRDPKQPGTTASELRPTLSDFELSDSSGALARLSDYRGKVVLLNFWATWCGPCRTEIPWFIEFEDAYRNRGFAVLGVSCDDEGWEIVQPFLAERGVNYRVVWDDRDVASNYDVSSLPVTLLIDRKGRLAAAHRGLVPRAGLEDEIGGLLAESR